ncbi:MAG: tRNA lysidine(34) synthetase TilS [Deltaproteobacteria bacterium]|nr:tRNA lysidine(34) synthetase TilS [Deltaproteobacteria bacterium]
MKRGHRWQSLVDKVGSFCARYSLFRPTLPIVVGVSGGSDSVFLLRVLHELAREALANAPLVVAHVNYGLRGKESDEDERFVRALADELGCSFEVLYPPNTWKGNFQDWAREIRYTFFREVSERCQAQGVAMGHTADDQAESILMHWMRGAGRGGLCGMQPKREGIVRPLLVVARKEVIEALTSAGMAFRTDQNNESLRYLRNRLRKEVISKMDELSPPQWRVRVTESSLFLSEEEAFLEQLTAKAFDSAVVELESGDLVFDLKKMRRVETPLRRRVWRMAVRRLADREHFLSFEQTDSLDRLALDSRQERGGRVLMLPGEVCATRYGEELWFWNAKKGVLARRHAASRFCGKTLLAPSPLPQGEELRVGESASFFEEAECCISCGVTIAVHKENVPRILTKGVSDSLTVVLDSDHVVFPLRVRFFEEGDRFLRHGSKGEKKVQDLFVDSKIPRHWRRQIPFVVDRDNRIIWIPGFGVASFAALLPGAGKSLLLTCSHPWWINELRRLRGKGLEEGMALDRWPNTPSPKVESADVG